MKPYEAALIGIAGFGAIHLKTMRELASQGFLRIRAVSDIHYEPNKTAIDGLTAQGVLYYRDYREMLQTEKNLDFVVVSTPIHLHTQMAVDVMESGNHVFLEKPPAVAIQDLDRIIRASRSTGKTCAVNFLLTSGTAFRELVSHLNKGTLGEIRTITGVGLWKRLESYYQRTPWAGKWLAGSEYVLDGALNNPLAHLLNNMLVLAASPQSRTVSAVTAELYHAHAIEGDDTACVKVEMSGGLNLYYYATLCHTDMDVPSITVEGSRGRAVWHYSNTLQIEAEGQIIEKNDGPEDHLESMYRNLCGVLSGEEQALYCSVESTRNFLLASNGAYESSGTVHAIPAGYTIIQPEQGSISRSVRGIGEIIGEAASGKKLFSEVGVEWAKPGVRFSLAGYDQFNLFR